MIFKQITGGDRWISGLQGLDDPGKGKGQCKGPGVGLCLVLFRNREKATVAGVSAGDKGSTVREVTGKSVQGLVGPRKVSGFCCLFLLEMKPWASSWEAGALPLSHTASP